MQLLPEQLKPVLPAPVREIRTQIEELHRAVDPGVKRARALGSQAKAGREAAAGGGRRRRGWRLRGTGASGNRRRLLLRGSRRRGRPLVAPVVTAQKAAEEAAKETLERAQDVTEAVAEAGEGAGQTVKCTSYPTPQERSSCWTGSERSGASGRARGPRSFAKASRLRANSAERERPVPDVGKALLGSGESS